MKLVQEKPAAILRELRKFNKKFSDEEPYASNLSENVDTTYSHLNNTLDKLEEKGLVEKKEKTGRKRLLELTEKGRKVAEQLEKVETTLSKEATTA
jgi:DNA-binding MarR family transcriptional regulator